MKVADLTVEEFRALVREVVYEALADYQGEDDDGELRPEFEAELMASLESSSVESRGKRVPLEEVAKELGIQLDAR